MSDRAVDIRAWRFASEHRFLLDTNVWLCVYGPATATRRPEARIYSKALRDMRQASSQIHLDLLVLSEFVNAFARQEYDRIRQTDRSITDFKSYRDSDRFQAVAEEICISATRMLGLTTRCQWEFDRADVGTLLREYAGGHADLNDLVLADLCRLRDLTFVTHDRDFKLSGIRILTANRRLLS
jgi:predicted nucleic acid-binding protein